MKLSKYRQKHAEVIGLLIALTDLLPAVKDAMDYSLSFVGESEEIATSTDKEKGTLELLSSQRESFEKETTKTKGLLQKERNALKKAKEHSVTKDKEWHKEFEKKRAGRADKENAEIKLHGSRINKLQQTETELKGTITRLERERNTIERELGKLKSIISEIG